MKKTRVCAVLGALTLSACVAPPTSYGGYQNPSQRLVMASLEEVATLARQTRIFLGAGKSQTDAIEAAKKTVAAKLKDPEAARFQNLRMVTYAEGNLVCGEVNGKNSYGAYVGYRPFAASPTDAVLESNDSRYKSTDWDANTGLRNACPASSQTLDVSTTPGDGTPAIPTKACPQDVLDRLRGNGMTEESIKRTCGR